MHLQHKQHMASTAQHSTAQHSTAQHSTAQHGMQRVTRDMRATVPWTTDLDAWRDWAQLRSILRVAFALHCGIAYVHAAAAAATADGDHGRAPAALGQR
jgi:hypothetical protein